MTKTKILLQKITAEIEQLPIAGYLKEEAIASLKYLHRYKLKNIEKNLTCFSDYLLFLNQQNTEKILTLIPESTEKKNTRDIGYFFYPHEKLPEAVKKKSLETIAQSGYELLTLIQGIKGILVLSIDEFCNASETRIGIHQMLMQQENHACLFKISSTKKKSKKSR